MLLTEIRSMIADEIEMMRVDESRPPASRSAAIRTISGFVRNGSGSKSGVFSAMAALSILRSELAREDAAEIKAAIGSAARDEIDDITVRGVQKILKSLQK